MAGMSSSVAFSVLLFFETDVSLSLGHCLVRLDRAVGSACLCPP